LLGGVISMGEPAPSPLRLQNKIALK
jgi:hypothetical protein